MSNKYTKGTIAISAISSLFFLTACGSGGGSNTTTYVNEPSGVLNSYTSLLSYAPEQSSTNTNQQAMVISAPTNLTSMQVIYYSDTACNNGVEVVTANGLAQLKQGVYSTTDASNYLLCSNFEMPYYAGCNGLANAIKDNEVKSFRFFYYYQDSATANPSFSQCMTNSSIGYEAPLNYTTNPATPCTQGSSCTLSSGYTYNLQPNAYQHQIFVTSSTYDGNLGGFTGADAKCNIDANKPTNPANVTYKALLNGNGATVFGINYYNTSNQLIATANGGNLDSVNNLSNPIGLVSNIDAWTGADSLYTCNNWTTNSNTAYGEYGFSEKTSGLWFAGSFKDCSQSLPLYCVSQ